MCTNRTSEWKVIAICISRELLLFNFEHIDISWASIINSTPKLWPFELSESFRCSILTVWLYHGRQSYIRVKTYGHLNFSELPLLNFEPLDISWASIIHLSQKLWPFQFVETFRVQFRGSRYLVHVNRISKWNVIAICISRELPLFNFEHIDIL